MDEKLQGVPGENMVTVAQPTVGRIVHFYTRDTSKWLNSQGEGPYPAIVTQVFGNSGSMANLKVFPPFGQPYDQGSVAHRAEAEKHGQMQWWDWAPRVANSIELYGEGVPAPQVTSGAVGAGSGGGDAEKGSPENPA